MVEGPVIKPRSRAENVGRSVYLPPVMWSALDAVSELAKRDEPDGKFLSRNWATIEMLDWALRQYVAKHGVRDPRLKPFATKK